mmetsp:Transcript_28532/g.33829  ORF Transcript_28532/g.33829 Transcript_28532/m.33829 type:complete len:113 (-) Transcript_28532:33-371(-)
MQTTLSMDHRQRGGGCDRDSVVTTRQSRIWGLRTIATVQQLGAERARLIDMLEWSQRDGSGVCVLNDMLDWLGFGGCWFPALLHANKNGYGVDTQKYSLGNNCSPIVITDPY